MAKIIGVDGMTREDLVRHLERGGRFVIFQYVVSVLVMTFRRSSNIYYVAPGESAAAKGVGWTLLTLVVGWWGVPWGFIYTPMAIFKNLSGGIDVTREVAAELLGAQPAVAAAAAPVAVYDVVISKRTYQWPDRLGYYVTFQRQGAAPIELEVLPDWYAHLNPGDAGTLETQNGAFWNFVYMAR